MTTITAIIEPASETTYSVMGIPPNLKSNKTTKNIYILRPTNRESAEDLKAASTGIPCHITIGQPRRRDRNAAWWSAIRFYQDNMPDGDNLIFATKEAIHQIAQIQIGHCEHYGMPDGQILKIPKGTAFDKMPDETEYTRQFFEPAMNWLAARMGYTSRQQLQEAIQAWSRP